MPRHVFVPDAHHFRHADEEGGFWYIEAVPDRGGLIVIKRAEITRDSPLDLARWWLELQSRANHR